MTVHIGGMLLLGWLWSMSSGSYYLPLVTIMLFIMLMTKAKISFFSSLIIAPGSSFVALLLYSFTMATVEFVESLLRVEGTYALPTHMWMPALLFCSVFTVLNMFTLWCLRHRYHIPFMTIVTVCVVSNGIAGLIAYLIPPLIMR